MERGNRAVTGWLRRRLEEKQEALRETEARYRDIFENAPVAIFRATPAGRFVVINPTYAAMAGYPSPEAMIEGLAKNHRVIAPRIPGYGESNGDEHLNDF